jgi:GT2 family glycosyltransferase
MAELGPRSPFCSIVVATHRRPQQLLACLEALSRLDYPHDRFEVIVVDDGGGAPLEHSLAPLRNRLELTLIVQRRAGAAAARNRGVAQSRGELLAFTDDDCVPDPGWLAALASRHIRDPDRALGGRTVNGLAVNPYSVISDLVVAVGYDQNNRSPDAARFFASNNLAVPAEGFGAVGGFDPRFMTSEDRDLCDRWLVEGWKMSSVPEAVVSHAHPLTFRSFCRQHFGYGRGLFLFHQAHARRDGRRVRLELSYYVRLLRAARNAGDGPGKLWLPILIAVCQVVNAAGFVWEWSIQRTVSSAHREHRNG